MCVIIQIPIRWLDNIIWVASSAHKRGSQIESRNYQLLENMSKVEGGSLSWRSQVLDPTAKTLRVTHILLS